MNSKIPEKVVNRLTIYHSLLVEYIEHDIKYISSPQIAARLNIDASQVRKDFNIIKKSGFCKRGYLVQDLKESIELTLGFEKKKYAIVVGAGHLGLALAKFDDFSNYGLNVLCLFDNDPVKVDMQIGDKQIFHVSRLPNLVQRLNADIAILTVPKNQAQKVTDIIVGSNIKYIWNFTPVILDVPKDIQVWNENLIASFLRFGFCQKP